jgi:hypothetical protein
MSDHYCDPRLNDYMDALRAGDASICDQLRDDNACDPEFLAKCGTIERVWLGDM